MEIIIENGDEVKRSIRIKKNKEKYLKLINNYLEPIIFKFKTELHLLNKNVTCNNGRIIINKNSEKEYWFDFNVYDKNTGKKIQTLYKSFRVNLNDLIERPNEEQIIEFI